MQNFTWVVIALLYSTERECWVLDT